MAVILAVEAVDLVQNLVLDLAEDFKVGRKESIVNFLLLNLEPCTKKKKTKNEKTQHTLETLVVSETRLGHGVVLGVRHGCGMEGC